MRQIFLLFFLVATCPFYAQKPPLVCYPPLEIPLELAGSFSELRANHFHSGIDIRTKGEENLAVYAADDGYVERIKISGSGYGKAIYIAHGSGYTTVYAHLNGFIPEIQSVLLQEHLKHKSYELDWYPEKGSIPIKRGQLIAYSGNTGGSSGPHLHFEVRNSATEIALNPLDFGLVVSDSLPPVFTGICLMELERGAPSSMPRSFLPKSYAVKSDASHDTLPVSGDQFRVAIAIDDPFGSGSKSCGVDELTMYYDDEICYHMKLDEVNFSTSKAINGFQPYGINKERKGQWYGCYRAENLPLKTVDEGLNGILNLSDTLIHKVRVVAKDWQRNTSELQFFVQRIKNDNEKIESSSKLGNFYESGKRHVLTWKGGQLILAESALYDDAYIAVTLDDFSSVNSQLADSKTHFQLCTVGHPLITLFKGAELVLDCSQIPEIQQSKAVIVKRTGDSWISEGGSLEGGKLKTTVSSLGTFAIALDLEKPIVEVEKWVYRKESAEFVIVLKVTDNLSGVSSYYPELNGEWLYYETDKKSNTLRCKIKDLPQGEHVFQLTVKDKVGNKRVFEKTIRLVDSQK